MSVVSSSSRRSVGEMLSTARMLTPGAPAYDMMTQRLVEEVKERASEEAARRKGATAVLFPHALDLHEMAGFSELYPEYRMIPLNSYRPIHSLWRAHRFMAVHAALDAVMTYSKRVVALADCTYQCGTRGLREVHVEGDSSNAVSVNSRFEMVGEYVKTARSRALIDERHGYLLSSSVFADYAQRRILQTCCEGDECKVHAEGMIVDLSMHLMSTQQVAAAMLQAGSEVAMVFLPYTPDAMASPTGELAQTGVSYSMKKGAFSLAYPEGLSGVTAYPLGLWNDWLTASTVTIKDAGGDGVDFRLELMQVRGPFLYGRMIRLHDRQPAGVTRHALEMPWASDKYVMRYSRLKALGAAPNDPGSWETADKLVDRHVVDKLYLYALAIDQKDFTPDTVLRRAAKMDVRVITSGTNVRLRNPPKPDDMVEIAMVVYAKAFVSRYEMGRLGSDMMGALSRTAAYGSWSRGWKVLMIFVAGISRLWGWTVGRWVDAVKTWLVKFLGSGSGKTVVPKWLKPPGFLLLDDYNGWYYKSYVELFKSMMGGTVASAALRGASLSVLSKGAGGAHKPVSVDLGAIRGFPAVVGTDSISDELVDTSVSGGVHNPGVEAMVEAVALENDVTSSSKDRMELPMQSRVPDVPQGHDGEEDYTAVPDAVSEINAVMESIFPGMAQQDYDGDVASMRYDPQERNYQAKHLEFPAVDPVKVARQEVYKSKFNNYGVHKKPQTLQETLTAINARTLAAPTMRTEADEMSGVLRVWNRMKEMFFSSDADEKLEVFRRDIVGFNEELMREWGHQARPENVQKVKAKAMEGLAAEDMKPWIYEIMMKTDAKPPLSNKPLSQVVPPQLIVMQDKYISALFSSIFRLMSRRFMSILRPEIMVNLIKSMEDVRDHIAANHPWMAGSGEIKFLENDFGKFDKSQDRFSFALMAHIMTELGFSQELLDSWLDANTKCTLRSIVLGILLVSDYQNKSGGPATALQNLCMNMASTADSYAGTIIIWGVFMGDDSLMACRKLVATRESLQRMSEVFNFEAKFYVLQNPYFASNFVLLDRNRKKVFMYPDPIKRVQKYSVSVNAVEPQWLDKCQGAEKLLAPYRYASDRVGLADAVRERYPVPAGVDLEVLFDGLATISDDYLSFRSCWDEEVTVLTGV